MLLKPLVVVIGALVWNSPIALANKETETNNGSHHLRGLQEELEEIIVTELDCSTVLCALPLCPEGSERYVPKDRCCPECRLKCENVLCLVPDCKDGFETVIEDGDCCPTCKEINNNNGKLDCSKVLCFAGPMCPEWTTAKPKNPNSGKCCEWDCIGKEEKEKEKDREQCGDKVLCKKGEVCCNKSCGICTEPEGACIEIACLPEDKGEQCGPVACPAGEVCCNDSCGICTPPGGGCHDGLCNESCGKSFCEIGQECCNPSCGICTEPGGFCTQQAC